MMAGVPSGCAPEEMKRGGTSIRQEREGFDPVPRLSAVDRLVFFSALASMLAVGIPVARALTSIREQVARPGARTALTNLLTDVTRGQSLSSAMSRMPGIFTPLQIGAVRGGERAGRLPAVLARLHAHETRALGISRRLKAVLTYPLCVFAFALLLVIALGRSLVTSMAPMLLSTNVKLNIITRAVIAFAQALERPAPLIVLLLACGGALRLVLPWLRSERGRQTRDRALMGMPITGPLLRRVETTRVCEALGVLHGSGLPMLPCLEMTVEACENGLTRDALRRAQQDISEGRSLSEAFARTGYFDTTVVQMVKVGEETRRLQAAFTRLAQLNTLEMDAALDQFAAAIEPLMFVVLGVVVGGIALVAFAPIYAIIETAL